MNNPERINQALAEALAILRRPVPEPETWIQMAAREDPEYKARVRELEEWFATLDPDAMAAELEELQAQLDRPVP